MPTNVVMPQMGESIAEGTIVRWIKKVGDAVDRDEPLFEISTDKVDAEIPSPAAGVLTDIKAKEGETVPVNSVVAVIGGEQQGAVAAPAADTTRRRYARRADPIVEGRADAATGSQRRAVRHRHQGRVATPEVVAAGAPYRARAQRRYHPDRGHRDQRPGHQAGHSRLHRSGRRSGQHGARGGGAVRRQRRAGHPRQRVRRSSRARTSASCR